MSRVLKCFLILLLFHIYPIEASVIKFEGIDSPKEKAALHRVSGYQDGTQVTPEELELVLNRLRKTGVFHLVNESADTNDNYIVKIQKKWTTIPILKFRNSGNDSLSTFGFYDPDIFGSMHELGVQLDRFNQSNSFVLWSRLNSLLSWRNRFGIEVWDVKRDIQERNKFRALETSYGLAQKRVVFFLERVLSEAPALKLFVSEEIISNDYSLEPIGNEIPRLATSQLADSTIWNKLSAGLTLGEIDSFDPASERGSETSITSTLINDVQGSSRRCLGADLKNRNFWSITPQLLLGMHSRAGYVSQCDPSFIYSLGGLFDLRGIAESSIVTRRFVLSTIELRQIISRNNWLLTQAVAGLDAALFSPETGDKKTALSTTLGMRFIFPKVYRLNVRIDYSKEVSLNSGLFSLGIQQFF